MGSILRFMNLLKNQVTRLREFHRGVLCLKEVVKKKPIRELIIFISPNIKLDIRKIIRSMVNFLSSKSSNF